MTGLSGRDMFERFEVLSGAARLCRAMAVSRTELEAARRVYQTRSQQHKVYAVERRQLEQQIAEVKLYHELARAKRDAQQKVMIWTLFECRRVVTANEDGVARSAERVGACVEAQQVASRALDQSSARYAAANRAVADARAQHAQARRNYERHQHAFEDLGRSVEQVAQQHASLATAAQSLDVPLSRLTQCLRDLSPTGADRPRSGQDRSSTLNVYTAGAPPELVAHLAATDASLAALVQEDDELARERDRAAGLVSTSESDGVGELSGAVAAWKQRVLGVWPVARAVLTDRLDALADQAASCDTRIAQLTRSIYGLQQELVDDRAAWRRAGQLQQLRERFGARILGSVGGQLSAAAPQYLSALLALVGARRSALVVDSVATVHKCLEHLKAHRLGRARFLVLEMLPQCEASPSYRARVGALRMHLHSTHAAQAGGAGDLSARPVRGLPAACLARDAVRTQAGSPFARVFSAILGTAIIAQTQTLALELLRDPDIARLGASEVGSGPTLPGYGHGREGGVVVATLAGDLFRSSGAVSGSGDGGRTPAARHSGHSGAATEQAMAQHTADLAVVRAERETCDPPLIVPAVEAALDTALLALVGRLPAVDDTPSASDSDADDTGGGPDADPGTVDRARVQRCLEGVPLSVSGRDAILALLESAFERRMGEVGQAEARLAARARAAETGRARVAALDARRKELAQQQQRLVDGLWDRAQALGPGFLTQPARAAFGAVLVGGLRARLVAHQERETLSAHTRALERQRAALADRQAKVQAAAQAAQTQLEALQAKRARHEHDAAEALRAGEAAMAQVTQLTRDLAMAHAALVLAQAKHAEAVEAVSDARVAHTQAQSQYRSGVERAKQVLKSAALGLIPLPYRGAAQARVPPWPLQTRGPQRTSSSGSDSESDVGVDSSDREGSGGSKALSWTLRSRTPSLPDNVSGSASVESVSPTSSDTNTHVSAGSEPTGDVGGHSDESAVAEQLAQLDYGQVLSESEMAETDREAVGRTARTLADRLTDVEARLGSLEPNFQAERHLAALGETLGRAVKKVSVARERWNECTVRHARVAQSHHTILWKYFCRVRGLVSQLFSLLTGGQPAGVGGSMGSGGVAWLEWESGGGTVGTGLTQDGGPGAPSSGRTRSTLSENRVGGGGGWAGGRIRFVVLPPGRHFRPVSQLSEGQRSVAGLSLVLALSVASGAPCLVLDEVDSALDAGHRVNLARLCLEHATVPVVGVTHDLWFGSQAPLLAGLYRRPCREVSTCVLWVNLCSLSGAQSGDGGGGPRDSATGSAHDTAIITG